ncbi:hypothetical protein [Streptomyces mirabilis]
MIAQSAAPGRPVQFAREAYFSVRAGLAQQAHGVACLPLNWWP